MNGPTDPLCGCPLIVFAANRRDRRDATRRGLRPTELAVRHRHGCIRTGKRLSDPGRSKPDDSAGAA